MIPSLCELTRGPLTQKGVQCSKLTGIDAIHSKRNLVHFCLGLMSMIIRDVYRKALT